MNILLTNYLEVRVDKHNYMPYHFEEVKHKDGTEAYEWVSMGKYFPKLSSCIDWLIHNELKESEVHFFVDYLDKYNKILKQMESKFDGVVCE